MVMILYNLQDEQTFFNLLALKKNKLLTTQFEPCCPHVSSNVLHPTDVPKLYTTICAKNEEHLYYAVTF